MFNNAYILLLLISASLINAKLLKSKIRTKQDCWQTSGFQFDFYIGKDSAEFHFKTAGPLSIVLAYTPDLNDYSYKVTISDGELKVYKDNNEASPICSYNNVVGQRQFKLVFDYETKEIPLGGGLEPCQDANMTRIESKYFGISVPAPGEVTICDLDILSIERPSKQIAINSAFVKR
jgi:hypothetical protein